MKDIFAILNELKIEVPEDISDSLRKSVYENYKTIAEHDKTVKKLTGELATATDTVKDLTEQVNGLQGDSEEIGTLRQKVTDYETAEQQRAKDTEAAEKQAAMKRRFEPLSGDRKFLNEATAGWMLSEFEKAVADEQNAGKSDAEIYEAITKDANIYENPQQQVVVPPVGSSGADADDEFAKRMAKYNKKE